MVSTDRSFRLFTVFIAAFFLQGCVAIFKTSTQNDVQLTTEEKDRDTRITVMNKPDTGIGSVTLDLERQHQAYQAVLKKEGYKDAYRAVYSDKFGAGTVVCLVLDLPFTPFIVPIAVDGAPGAFKKYWNYEDPYAMAPPQVKIPERRSSEKYLYHESTSFDIEKDDTLIVEYKKPSDYQEGEEPDNVEFSSEDLQAENIIFNSDINELLVRMGYRDTSKEEEGLSLNDYNSVALKSTVEGLRVRMYEKQQSFFKLELTVNWELKDNYGEQLYDTTISTESGQFARDVSAFDFYEEGETYGEKAENIENASQQRFKLATLDAMQSSLIQLVQNPKVSDYMEKGEASREKEAMANMETLKIPEPSGPSKNNMNKQMEGAVTLQREEGHGSGCILSKDGYILTNYHVVSGLDTLNVLFDPDTEKEGVVKRKSKMMDLALLKVDTSGLSPLKVRQNEELNIGSEVMAIGTPKSVQLGKSVSKGIVSGKRELNEVEYIQTDVSINSGNSGGPLIDRSSGEMIGVVTAKMFGIGVEGIGFALPAQEALKRLKVDYR